VTSEDDMQEFGESKVGQRVEGEDLEFLEGLHVVPDVGDPALKPAEEMELEVTAETVDEVFEVVEAQNATLVNQLGIMGKTVNPLMLLKIQVDTLIDFVMGGDEARKQYELACSMRLNETLKVVLAQSLGAEVG
jgi:hypothetical protein